MVSIAVDYVSHGIGGDALVQDDIEWRSEECMSHSTCFDLPADRITCLLVEWFAFAGTIVWVADGWLFFADCLVFA